MLTYRAEVPVNGSGPDALTIIAFHLFDLGGALARVPSDVPRDFILINFKTSVGKKTIFYPHHPKFKNVFLKKKMVMTRRVT